MKKLIRNLRELFVNRVKKVSSLVIFVTNILLVLVPAMALAKFLFIDTNPAINLGIEIGYIKTGDGLTPFTECSWPLLAKLIATIGNLVGSIPMILGLWFLRKLFKNYERGEIFSSENVGFYKVLGFLGLAYGLITEPIAGMLVTLGATIANPAGHRYIMLSFGSANIEAVLFGALVIIISWVMAEGYSLREDQKLTV